MSLKKIVKKAKYRLHVYFSVPKTINKILKDNPNGMILFTETTIGDQCLELAYLSDYKQYNNIERVTILTHNKEQAIFKYFSGEYEALYEITFKQLADMLNYFRLDKIGISKKYTNRLICVFHGANVKRDVIANNKYISLADITKIIYHIPVSCRPNYNITHIKNSYVNELLEEGTIEKNHTVVINPSSNSCIPPPVGFFEKIASKLKACGYVLVCDASSGITISECIPLKFPLDCLIELVDTCGYLIGARSGYMDLACFSHAKIAAIDRAEYDVVDACILEDWWPESNAKTFRYDNCNEDKVLNNIIEYVKNSG